MIRRSITLENNAPAWLLIDQPTHARIACELADQWGAAPFARPRPAKILLPTIQRHDDGWRAWEVKPEVDPKTGWPYAFTEMPPDISFRIWKASILACSDLGPLSQFLAATHFVRLSQRGNATKTSEATQFYRDFEKQADQWLKAWQQASPATNTTDMAHSALEYLQMFDALSLWICCDEKKEPHEFTTPEGVLVRCIQCAGGRINVAPWPWLIPRLDIQLTARVVPARPYRDTGELETVPPAVQTLTWSVLNG